jgi:selenocysteine-specific elongation factor
MKGFGTVVTGTLVAGTIRKEDELELFPSKKRVRVRGVQVHGSSADRAIAGERTALNLAGVDKDQLARGMTLATPGLLHATSRLEVRLSLLSSAKPLKTGARVHLHAFASETIATVRLLEGKQLQAGSSAFAHLQLGDPLLLVPGDRFIIRQFSPVITIGGGVIVDASPLKKMPAGERLNFLQALSS